MHNFAKTLISNQKHAKMSIQILFMICAIRVEYCFDFIAQFYDSKQPIWPVIGCNAKHVSV